MSELTDLLVTQTDPVTALLIVALFIYIRKIENDVADEIDGLNKDLTKNLGQIRDRIKRLEDRYFPDGGVTQNDD